MSAGKLKVTVCEARGLAAKDDTTSDPYCEIVQVDLKGKNKGKTLTTDTVDKTLSPVWNESFELAVDTSAITHVSFEVRDKDQFSSQFLGELRLAPSVFAQSTAKLDRWFPLVARLDKPDKAAQGEIRLVLEWSGPLLAGAAAPTAAAAAATPTKAAAAATTSAPDSDKHVEAAPAPATATEKPKKKKRTHRKRGAVFAGPVTVHVLKARGLRALHDDTSDPFVEVSIRDADNKELVEDKTAVIKQTLAPEWNAEFKFDIDPAAHHTVLRFMVRGKDKEKAKSEFLGDLRVPLDQLPSPGVAKWHELTARPEFPDKPGQGELYIRLDYEAPATTDGTEDASVEEHAETSATPRTPAAAAPETPKKAASTAETPRKAAAATAAAAAAAPATPAPAPATPAAAAPAAAAPATPAAAPPAAAAGGAVLVPSDHKHDDAAPSFAGSIRVHLIEARNLLIKDDTTSDPFGELCITTDGGAEEQAKTSKVIKKTLNPVWNESFAFDVSSKHRTLRIELRDKDLMATQFLGLAQFPLQLLNRDDVVSSGKLEAWFKLEPRPEKQEKEAQGDVRLRIDVEHREKAPLSRAPSDASVAKTPAKASAAPVAVAAATPVAAAATPVAAAATPVVAAAATPVAAAVTPVAAATPAAAASATTPAAAAATPVVAVTTSPGPEAGKAPDSESLIVASEIKSTKPAITGRLHVTVIEARNLLAKDGKSSDPFCEVTMHDNQDKEISSKKTKTVKKSIAPQWNETFDFDIDQWVKSLVFEIREKDAFKTQFLGQVIVPAGWLNEVCVPANGQTFDAWFKLEHRADKPDKPAQGDVRLKLVFTPPHVTKVERRPTASETALAASVAALKSGGNATAVATAASGSEPAVAVDAPPPSAATTAAAAAAASAAAGHVSSATAPVAEAAEAAAAGAAPTATATATAVPVAAAAAEPAAEPLPYIVPSKVTSSAKPFSGKLTVTVHEARNLLAKDGPTSDPFCEVAVLDSAGKEKSLKKTKALKKTATPQWEEQFEFDIDPTAMQLRLEVRDKDMFKTQFLGQVLLPIAYVGDVCVDDKVPNEWYLLEVRRDKAEKVAQGEIRISLKVAFSQSSLMSPRARAKPDEAVEGAAAAPASSSAAAAAPAAAAPASDGPAWRGADGVITSSAITTQHAALVGRVTVHVIEARGLLAKDGATSDPYGDVAVLDAHRKEKVERKTKSVKKTTTPQWNESFDLDVDATSVWLRVSIRDKDTFKTQFLGEARVPIAWLGEVCTPATQHSVDGWFKLEARIDKPDKSAQGEVHLRFVFSGASASEEEQAAAAADMLSRKGTPASLFGAIKAKVAGGVTAVTQSSDAREALAKELAQFQREAAQYGSREGTLSLCVVSAKDLLAKDEGGVSDPFCIVTLLDSTVQRRGVEMKTHTIEKTLAPSWNKDFAIPLDRDCTHIRFEVRDKDDTKTQFLGLATVPIGSIPEQGDDDAPLMTLPLTIRVDHPEKPAQGELHVRMAFRAGAPAGAVKKAPSAADAAKFLAQADGARLAEANALLSSLGDGVKFEGTLSVVAIGARNLEAKDDGGVSDPFCIVSVLSMGGKEIESKKGKPITRTIKPIWNDAYTFVLRAADTITHIKFEVRDDDGSTSQFLGEAYLCLGALRSAPGNKMTSWLPLLPRPDKPHKGGSGDVHVLLEWQEGVLPAEKSLLGKMSSMLTMTNAADEAALVAVRQKAAVDSSKYGVPPATGGTLRVTVHEARNLLARDEGAASDPFASIDLLTPDWSSALRRKTKTLHDTADPTWEEVFTLPLTELTSHVRVDIRDQDTVKSQSIGCVVVPIGKLMSGLVAADTPIAIEGEQPSPPANKANVPLRWYPLEARADRAKPKFVQGHVCLSLEYFAPGEPVPHIAEGRATAAQVYITVLEARGLAHKKPHPTVIVRALSGTGKKLALKQTAPVKADDQGVVKWNRELQLDLFGVFERLHLEMRHQDTLNKLSSSFLGEVFIDRHDLETNPLQNGWFPLRPRDTDKATKASGEVRLQINYVSRDGVLSAEQLALVPPVGILSLKVIAGRKLMAKDDDTGASDPFCQVRIVDNNGKEVLDYESDEVKATINPRWKNQKFYFRLNQSHDHLEIEVRDADQLKSQFLGFISMPLKELNLTPSAERWIKLAPRPDSPTEAVSGDLLVRWNFTRTQALRTQAMVDAEALQKRQLEIAAAPTPRINRIAAEKEWDTLSAYDKLRVVMRLHPHTTKHVVDALLLRDVKLTAAFSLLLLVACVVIDFLDVPACSWLWVLVAMGAYIWLLFDSIVFDPVAWQKLSTARADLAAKLAAEAKAKEEADKAAAAAAAAAAAGGAAAAPAKAEAEAKKAEAEKAEAAVAEEKKEFVLPPVPPPRVTYAETLSKPHETDGSAALVLASVDYFVGLLREVAGAGVRPALHLRVTIGIIVVSIVCGFLSEIAPSCVTAFLMLEGLMAVPYIVERSTKVTNAAQKKSS